MASYSRATPGCNWIVGADTASHSRATPGRQWEVQVASAAGGNPKNPMGGIMFDGPMRRIVFDLHERKI